MSAELFLVGRPQRTCDRCGRPTKRKDITYIGLAAYLCKTCAIELRKWVTRGVPTQLKTEQLKACDRCKNPTDPRKIYYIDPTTSICEKCWEAIDTRPEKTP